MVPPAQLGLAELHDEIGVSSSGPAGVDAAVKVCCRLQVLVPQQLAYQLVRARVGVEDDLGCQMTELVGAEFHPKMPQNGLLDSDLNRSLGSGLAREGDKHRIGAHAGHPRG